MSSRDSGLLSNAVAALAASGVARGQWWCHHRDPDVPYRVVDVAVLEATLVPVVAYRRVDGTAPTWVRPLEEFLGDVEHECGIVPRFRRVSDDVARVVVTGVTPDGWIVNDVVVGGDRPRRDEGQRDEGDAAGVAISHVVHVVDDHNDDRIGDYDDDGDDGGDDDASSGGSPRGLPWPTSRDCASFGSR